MKIICLPPRVPHVDKVTLFTLTIALSWTLGSGDAGTASASTTPDGKQALAIDLTEEGDQHPTTLICELGPGVWRTEDKDAADRTWGDLPGHIAGFIVKDDAKRGGGLAWARLLIMDAKEPKNSKRTNLDIVNAFQKRLKENLTKSGWKIRVPLSEVRKASKLKLGKRSIQWFSFDCTAVVPGYVSGNPGTCTFSLLVVNGHLVVLMIYCTAGAELESKFVDSIRLSVRTNAPESVRTIKGCLFVWLEHEPMIVAQLRKGWRPVVRTRKSIQANPRVAFEWSGPLGKKPIDSRFVVSAWESSMDLARVFEGWIRGQTGANVKKRIVKCTTVPKNAIWWSALDKTSESRSEGIMFRVSKAVLVMRFDMKNVLGSERVLQSELLRVMRSLKWWKTRPHK